MKRSRHIRAHAGESCVFLISFLFDDVEFFSYDKVAYHRKDHENAYPRIHRHHICQKVYDAERARDRFDDEIEDLKDLIGEPVESPCVFVVEFGILIAGELDVRRFSEKAEIEFFRIAQFTVVPFVI